MKKLLLIVIAIISIINCNRNKQFLLEPTKDNGKYFYLKKSDLSAGAYHLTHSVIFGKNILGYNNFILRGIDKVQSMAPNGGGYFTGLKSTPAESPIGYELKFLGKSLIEPPRSTSYCSGASFSAFIEGMNFIFQMKDSVEIDNEHFEALRMQESDGSRRNDWVKFWGNWNADGFGNHFALVQNTGIGEEIKPENARPGDFMNISWKSGNGHSVIFLGWYIDNNDDKFLLYWSSQKSTNGIADQLVSIDRIKSVKVVRIIKPENIFNFDIEKIIEKHIEGDIIEIGKL